MDKQNGDKSPSMKQNENNQENDESDENNIDIINQNQPVLDAINKEMKTMTEKFRNEFCEEVKGMKKRKEKEDCLDKTSNTFHQMGLLSEKKAKFYFLQNDMHNYFLNILQGVGLLNGAKAGKRGDKCDKEKIDSDLRLMINDVLFCGNAKNKEVEDVLKLSKTVTQEVENFRKRAKEPLDEISSLLSNKNKAINQTRPDYTTKIKNHSITVTNEYKQIMKNAWKKCVEIMGKPRREHTLIGLGSMARFEITPYSDFEHAVLVENIADEKVKEETLQKLRFIALLFQIVLLNLGQTVIRFLGVTHLNNFIKKSDWFYDEYTPCGVSADSLVPFASKNALGRLMKTPNKQSFTELIKCVDDMIEYLDGDIAVKEDYHLSDILLQVCFVDGKEAVMEEYVDKVHNKMLLQPDRKKKYLSQSEKYAKEFNTKDAMSKNYFSSSSNLKWIFHRSLLILPALGRAHDIDLHEKSNYDVIDELSDKGLLNEKWSQNMKIAVAVASMIRLKVYSNAGGQDDFVPANKSFSIFQTTSMHDIIKSIDEAKVLQFLISLHYIQTKIINGYVTEHSLLAMRFHFMERLRMHQNIVDEYKKSETDDTYILRIAIEAMSALDMDDDVVECSRKLVAIHVDDDKEYVNNREWAATYLTNIEQRTTHQTALAYLRDAVDVIDQNNDFYCQLSKDEKFLQSKPWYVFSTYSQLGTVNTDLGSYDEAQLHFNQAWKIVEEYESDFNKNDSLVYCKIHLLNDTGHCYTLQGELEHGREMLQKSLILTENKMSHDLELLVKNLYDLSWNCTISYDFVGACRYINRAVEILGENEDERLNYIRFHQRYIDEHSNLSKNLLLALFRFSWKLTAKFKTFPVHEEIATPVSQLLNELVIKVDNQD